MNKTLKILHIITSLEHGGAQLLASKLILDNNESLKHYVFVLVNKGPYKLILQRKGVEVISPPISNFFLFLPLLFLWYIKNRPDIVHTWMYHSDFVGLILSLFFKKHKLIWSLHHADPKNNKLLTKSIISTCKFFSASTPSKIIACSELAFNNHTKYGYSKKNMMIINNGIDFTNFIDTGNSNKDYEFKSNIVIGHIARWHEIKGHKYFIEMASDLYKQDHKFSFIMVGTGIDWSNKELVLLLKKNGLIDAVQLLGEQEDISKVLNNIDIYISSSINESFSLTLVEAIACRVLSISSDTGVAREALSDDLCIVDIKNSTQLIGAVKSLISMPPNEIRKIIDDSYEKIQGKFNEKIMFDSYYNLYNLISYKNN